MLFEVTQEVGGLREGFKIETYRILSQTLPPEVKKI